jgi:probable FeS assembly SUF system protein SufT
MSEPKLVTLTRQCVALEIPAGIAVNLPAGAEVDIAQSLGGSYTVIFRGGLFRIASQDADALGIEPQASTDERVDATRNGGSVDEASVWAALKTCYDPEIPVNIVDLGLIYDLRIDSLPTGRSRVLVRMTLTAPGCGMGAVIAGDARSKILSLPGVEEAAVDLVWDPPWERSMISEEGRLALGLD